MFFYKIRRLYYPLIRRPIYKLKDFYIYAKYKISKKLAQIVYKKFKKFFEKFNKNNSNNVSILLLNHLTDEDGFGEKFNKEWEERWNSDEYKKVLYFATKDYAGSFYKWADALNTYSNYAIRMISLTPHQYNYPLDMVSSSLITNNWEGVRKLFSQADIIHIKDEMCIFNKSDIDPIRNLILDKKFSHIPKIFTAYGSFHRHLRNDKSYLDHLNFFDGISVMTPDLNYEGCDGTYIPQAINSEIYKYCWKDSNKIGHSPTHQQSKGTKEFLEALGELKCEGNHFTLDLIENVSFQECIQRKKLCGLFFDQAGLNKVARDISLGWYGNSALESAVYGIPTIAHTAERSFEGAIKGGVGDIRGECGILNTGLKKDDIKKVIKDYLDLSYEERLKVSLKTKNWIENFHGFRSVSQRMSQFYSRYL